MLEDDYGSGYDQPRGYATSLSRGGHSSGQNDGNYAYNITDLGEFQPLVDYLCQQGFYQSVERLSTDVMNRNRGSPLSFHARYWKGFALTMLGQRVDAMRELQPLRQDPTFALATVSLMIQASKGLSPQEMGGPDVSNKLKEELKALTKNATEEGFLLAARYFWLADKPKQAKTCVDKVFEKNPDQYVYIYTYTYKHIHIHTYTYKHTYI